MIALIDWETKDVKILSLEMHNNFITIKGHDVI